MYDRILVPTDGNDGAESALEQAIDLARQYDAALHAIYAIDTPAFSSEFDVGVVYDAFEELGRKAVGEIAQQANAAGIDTVETAVLTGSPHRAILSYADENDIDLIVMGTHGRRGLDRYLLGSVTERVVRLADVPVLTVRTTGDSSGASTRVSDA